MLHIALINQNFVSLQMDDYSNRRSAGRFVLSRKEPNLIMRGSAESNRCQNDHTCSRIGCTSQVNPVKNVQIGSPRRATTSKSPFRSFGRCRDTSADSSGSSVLKTSRSFFNLKMKLPAEIDSFALKKNNQGAKNGASTSTGSSRISDVVSTSSASFSELGRKRIEESKSSMSGKGKKVNGPVTDDRRKESGNRGIAISNSRQRRNLSPRDDETVSLQMLRLTERTRGSNQETPNRLSLDVNTFSLVNQFHAQNVVNRASSFSRTSGIRDRSQPSRSLDVEIGHSYMNQEALRHYNLDALTEMLLALERIEQAEEKPYEQLLVDANLFLGGLSLHDQHWEMRLDIDNMSYEELLALEETMGTVNTAVPEEALKKSLKRSTYQGTSDCIKNDDDIKCSICQEEYGNGDEIGRLSCEHRYHVDCIHQWLRLKNWCPICKTSVEPWSLPS